MHMSMRRFTRLTNAFRKKIENHVAMVALHVTRYNFIRIHQTLRVTPAMEAGVTNRLMTIMDMVCVVEQWEGMQPHEKVGRKSKLVAVPQELN